MASFEDKLDRVLAERVELVAYDDRWPALYDAEVSRLRPFFEGCPILRIEHVGSTAVPGLAAKPIIDILVIVDDVEFVDRTIAPRMEAAGYDYFWRPVMGDSGPSYPWFIGRGDAGHRVSHIHVSAPDDAAQWDRVIFRDYLRTHPVAAREYAELKRDLAARHAGDRAAYTQAKSEFIAAALAVAR